MPDQHWENLKEIFHATLALPPHERASFIEKSSHGDDSLRRSIESLLKAHEQTNNFVDTPAYQAAAEMLIEQAELRNGQLVAHYRIISLLGEGGMGRVYLAEDTRLHRRVCLKFLSARFTANPEWLRRFEQEARAASALNNPNILTIYEIGDADGHRFIATEFIEGQTLRERLRTGIDIQSAINVAIQIGSALVAAHRVSIIHRDIKPENIMVRDEDGLVKVLDFGLAKMSVEEVVPTTANEIHNPDTFTTNPGVLMGTVAYMSPEQAKGEEVDARTDVWSLGAVLYEMVSGQLPFTGNSAKEILSAILATPPARLEKLAARDVPPALIEVIAKALNKRREQRYANSVELLEHLKLVQGSLPTPRIQRNRLTSGSAPSMAARLTRVDTEERISSAGYLVRQVGRHKRGAFVLAIILLLAIAGGLGVYGWRAKRAVAGTNSPHIKSLAVLPFKSLNADDNYVGIGIADAVIRKIGQTGKLTVRPTSAVLKYAKDNIDSAAVGRELNADAVLEGTVQRSGDRLRVTVNLLRISDGASLYSDNFDLGTADVFAIQDKVAQKVASRLQIGLDTAARSQLNAKYPTDPRAYELYIRGVASLDERGYEREGLPQMIDTINFFKKAIEIDPKYALAHAKLAFAYAWTAVAIEPGNSTWEDLARDELRKAQELDPNLAENHVVHAYMLWTRYEGYQTEAAIRELLLARQLDPNSNNPDLPALLGHIGLEDMAARELQRAQQIDPTSQSLKDLRMILLYLRADADAWFAERKKFPSGFAYTEPWYYMRKGQLGEAQKAIDERLPKSPESNELLMRQTLLMALRGESTKATARIPGILSKIAPENQGRHHSTYDAACVNALAGNSTEAVKWLRETAATGFPNYSLFARDPFLNRIRNAPEFVQFMAEQKTQWERYRQEFDK